MDAFLPVSIAGPIQPFVDHVEAALHLGYAAGLGELIDPAVQSANRNVGGVDAPSEMSKVSGRELRGVFEPSDPFLQCRQPVHLPLKGISASPSGMEVSDARVEDGTDIFEQFNGPVRVILSHQYS